MIQDARSARLKDQKPEKHVVVFDLRAARYRLDLSVTNISEQLVVKRRILKTSPPNWLAASFTFTQFNQASQKMQKTIIVNLAKGSTTTILSLGANLSIFLSAKLLYAMKTYYENIAEYSLLQMMRRTLSSNFLTMTVWSRERNFLGPVSSKSIDSSGASGKRLRLRWLC